MKMVRILTAALAVLAAGCSNRGEEIADRMNERIVGHINKGDIQSIGDLKNLRHSVFLEVLDDMGMDRNARPPDSEWKAYTKKLKEFEPKWKLLIQEKWGDSE